MIYQLYKTNPLEIKANAAYYTNEQGEMISFLFDPQNTDYAQFKAQILADEAQLQDTDGNTMSAAEAKEYISTLP